LDRGPGPLIRLCPGCGASYQAQVDRCPECDESLEEYLPAAPASVEGAAADEVVFELSDWTPDERTTVRAQLTVEQIPHRWEESDLVVREGDADLVDDLLDKVEDEAGDAGTGDH
jgi:hypothetical protein